MPASVAVVGGGMSGLAAAGELHRRGLDVVVIDRGQRLGGRLGARTLRGTGLPYDGRIVDLGASYLTADDPRFVELVGRWTADGLAREWTDTFHVAGPAGITGTTSGPLRYAAPGGLRSLADDLALQLPSVVNPRAVESVERSGDGVLVDGDRFDAAVLAMPDAQVLDVLGDDDPLVARLDDVVWEPVLVLVAAFASRRWPDDLEGLFVNGDPVLSFVADDGRRRGDGAPVLVAHSTPAFAADRLDDPSAAAPELIDRLGAVLGVPAPAWHEVKRWSLAKPDGHRAEAYALDGPIAVCGDAWGARPRVQTAWLSGRAAADSVAGLLGA